MDPRVESPYDNFNPGLWDGSLGGGASHSGSRSPSPTANMKLIEADNADMSPRSEQPVGRLLRLTAIDTISDTVPDSGLNLQPVPDSCQNHKTPKRRGLFFKRKPKQPKPPESPKKTKSKKDKPKKDTEKKQKEKDDKKSKKGDKDKSKKEIEATVQIPTSSFPTTEKDADADLPLPLEEFVERTRAEKCANCCKKFMAFLFSTLGLSGMMIAYTFFGGFIFMNLEGPFEENIKNNVKMTRKWHVEHLWNRTIEMNVFHPDNWTAMAEEVLQKFQTEVFIAIRENGWDGKDGETEVQWTFAGAMLYSITVITTIGYGHITPKTNWGRLVTIIYALFGIPLTLLTVSNLGSIMATSFRFLYKNVCCGICCLCCQKPDRNARLRANLKFDAENGDPGASKRLTAGDSPNHSPKKTSITVTWRHGIQRLLKTSDNKTVSVPISVSLLLITAYILFGAVLFTLWEDDWDILIGSYFCFITLTTIGFGDYVPGTAYDSWASQEKLIFCSMYLIFGLALIAMCFDLMQEEVRNKCRSLGKKLGLVSKKSKGKDQSTKGKDQSTKGKDQSTKGEKSQSTKPEKSQSTKAEKSKRKSPTRNGETAQGALLV